MSILVMHAKREFFRDTSFYGCDHIITAAQILQGIDDRTMYDWVATTETDDLDIAYRLTNHINSNWLENDGIIRVEGVDQARSTSVGDLFIAKNGIYIVASCGFDLIRNFSAPFGVRANTSAAS